MVAHVVHHRVPQHYVPRYPRCREALTEFSVFAQEHNIMSLVRAWINSGRSNQDKACILHDQFNAITIQRFYQVPIYNNTKYFRVVSKFRKHVCKEKLGRIRWRFRIFTNFHKCFCNSTGNKHEMFLLFTKSLRKRKGRLVYFAYQNGYV